MLIFRTVKMRYTAFLALLALMLSAFPAGAQVLLDFENGIVASGYNDVRIPGDGGTKFSLSDDLKSDPVYFYRFRLGYLLDRHSLSLLVAPLRVESEGKVDRDIRFRDTVFPADTDLKSEYRFDSYRATYRYDFFVGESLRIGAGLTGKIRDASISLEGGGQREEKKNTGFVPLINFSLQWIFVRPFSLLVDGDALFSPYGRAEDILFALQYHHSRRLAVRLGYRMLEGGADNDEVYTFALFHYAVFGITLLL
jgi:hypothetical protein